MKIVRAAYRDRVFYGLMQGERVAVLAGAPFDTILPTQETIPLSQLRLLAPSEPGKIVAVGLNYADHIAEMHDEYPGDPVLFLKPSTAAIGPEDVIVHPAGSRRVDHEAELAVVIRKTCRHAKAEDMDQYILGYTCLNDVTARDIQKKDGQWTRGKGFDTFAPFGPWVDTDFRPEGQAIEARVNGQVRQRSTLGHMIVPPKKLLEYIAAAMTLLPGDVVCCGTPEGVGPMEPGDTVEIEIEGLATLRNTVGRDEHV